MTMMLYNSSNIVYPVSLPVLPIPIPKDRSSRNGVTLMRSGRTLHLSSVSRIASRFSILLSTGQTSKYCLRSSSDVTSMLRGSAIVQKFASSTKRTSVTMSSWYCAYVNVLHGSSVAVRTSTSSFVSVVRGISEGLASSTLSDCSSGSFPPVLGDPAFDFFYIFSRFK